jgi:uncharacterized membrane-anchored protein
LGAYAHSVTVQDKAPAKLDRRYLRTKVPEITALFWVLKLLTTGMGEAMSDFLGDHSVPIAAAIGVAGMVLALRLQFRKQEFKAPYYWFVVMVIAIFGTMVADAIHDGASIGYDVTTPLFGLCVAAVFYRWYRSEGTLSIHTIITPRRERYYWLAVFFTFALGTAAGDLTATSFNLGFFASAMLFIGIILIPAVAWWKFNMNPTFAFWFAYVDTRPIGASFSDWISKPHNITGLNYGDGRLSGTALAVFIALVLYATVTEHGLQAHDELEFEPAGGSDEHHSRPAPDLVQPRRAVEPD